MTPQPLLAGLATLAGLVLATPMASAAEITPLSYSFDQPTGCGSYCYQDEGGRQLIDGVLGRAGWAANLGQGNAQEWVGWVNRPVVNIDFSFDGVQRIGEVQVGTTQDNIFDVVLPSVSVSTWNGSAWSVVATLSVPESSSNDVPDTLSLAAHGFLTLGGLNIQASQLRVSLSLSADGPWTFADEVRFISAPVPEPGTWALMAAGLVALGARARRRQHQA